MTDEAKALVDAVDRYVRVCTTGSSDGAKYRARKNLMDLIETQAREIERLRTEGRFLLARLDELEWLDGQLEETARDYFGHVEPAIYHFRAALAGDSHDQ